MRTLISTLIILFSLAALNIPGAYPETLVGSGCSVSNTGYLTELAKDYERLSGAKVFVRGGGSVVGLEDLKSGKVDFAASCRRSLPGDPADIEFIQVAWDALVFIVHKSNPLDNITISDARAIYTGKITNWKQLKGSDAEIDIFISRPHTGHGLSGVETSITEMLLEGTKPSATPNTKLLASTGIVEQMVEKTVTGFATAGFSSARKRDLKMLKVAGIYPDKQNIISGKYPFKRPLFLLAPKDPKPELKKFIDFALSKQGQELISSYGVVSLLDVK
ncbi:MAG: phosphate ABC transporter substrate-binding protein [Nitrospirae bacterium]|nr:phosphate ABC transporter substrate-binding protein [Nitrospirota bacterium]